MVIGEHLELDVLRPLDEAFQVELGIAKGVHRLGRGRLEGAPHLTRVAYDAHAAAAAAAAGLDHHRVADARGFGLRVVGVLQGFTAGQER